LNLGACVCWVMLLINVAFTAWHWRFRRVFAHGQTVLGGLLMAPMVCVFLIDWLLGNSWADPTSMCLINALLLRLSAVLPAGLPVAAVAAAIPVALLTWSAARLFRGVELSPPATAARA